MLIEASIRDLITSTNQIETKARQHIAYQVQITGGFQTLKVGPDLVFQSNTSTGHHPKIRITGFEEYTGPGAVNVVTVAGEELSVRQLSVSSRAYVSCDCEDFIYRFAATNQQYGVLFGKITRPSIPKTNRVQNLGLIGVCKHLIKFVELLKSEGIVR